MRAYFALPKLQQQQIEQFSIWTALAALPPVVLIGLSFNIDKN
jgi:hypothetical protein